MKIFSAIALLTAVLAGCSSPGASNPAQVAPRPEDWEAAFSRLSPEDQATIRVASLSLDAVGPAVQGSIYHMTARGLTQELIRAERLNIASICDGFNRAFGRDSGRRWTIVDARSYEQIGTPDGVQRHRFELDWTLRNPSGRTVSLSAMDAGPGVKIIWGASREKVDAEMNQAFALTFLELVAQLRNPQPGA